MKLFVAFVRVFLVVVLVAVKRESEARRFKPDYSDDNELGFDKAKLDPIYDIEFDEQQPSKKNKYETETQAAEDLGPSTDLDKYGQGQETESDAQNEVETDYKNDNLIKQEPEAVYEIVPNDDNKWYQKVGHFLKKHVYIPVKNSFKDNTVKEEPKANDEIVSNDDDRHWLEQAGLFFQKHVYVPIKNSIKQSTYYPD